MLITVIAFCVVFALIAGAGIVLLGPKATPRPVSFLEDASIGKRSLTSTIRKAGDSIGTMVGHLDSIVPKSQAEASVAQQKLIRAGFRSEAAVKIFYGGKFIAIVSLVGISLATGLASQNYLLVLLFAVGAGYLGPDMWLGNRIKGRQKRINRSLPDVLDLLTVCVEAGLGLDQAVMRTAEELGKSLPDISEELGIVILEQRAGCPRADAWRHFADRIDIASIRNVVSMLVQAETFGTSIAKMLRVHSDTLRTQRIQEIEEAAAKTTTKMLFPLVLLIFPAIFLVTLGPAVILMMETLGKSSTQ